MLLSPGGLAEWTDASHIKMLTEKPKVSFMAVTSDKDKYTAVEEMKMLRDYSASSQTHVLVYKGTGHGLPLLELDPSLKDKIVNWLLAD